MKRRNDNTISVKLTWEEENPKHYLYNSSKKTEVFKKEILGKKQEKKI